MLHLRLWLFLLWVVFIFTSPSSIPVEAAEWVENWSHSGFKARDGKRNEAGALALAANSFNNEAVTFGCPWLVHNQNPQTWRSEKPQPELAVSTFSPSRWDY